MFVVSVVAAWSAVVSVDRSPVFVAVVSVVVMAEVLAVGEISVVVSGIMVMVVPAVVMASVVVDDAVVI